MKKLLVFFVLGLIGFGASYEFFSNATRTKSDINVTKEIQTEVVQTPPPPPVKTGPPIIAETNEILVPVLVYHRVKSFPVDATEKQKLYTISPEWFEKHLIYLEENGFTTVLYSDLIAYFEKGTPLPEKPVIINFDDGYKEVYTNAFPILKKHNMKGTMFLIAGSIGYGAQMTVDQIKEMQAYGMEIGAHSMTHPSLTKVANAKEEIENSKKILEEKFGVKVDVFAYPNGAVNDHVEQLVKNAGFKLARIYTNAKGISTENLFRIPVIQTDHDQGLETWERYLYVK